MNLLIITPFFPPDQDGVGDYSFQLSKTLCKHHVVYILKKGRSLDSNFIFNTERFNPSILLVLAKQIKPDFILFQYVPYLYSKRGVPAWLPIAFARLRQNGFKIITTFHEIARGYETKLPSDWAIASIQRLIAWQLAALSTASITSTSLYFKMLKPFSKKLYRIGIGSNFPEPNSQVIKTDKVQLISFANRVSLPLLAALKALMDACIAFQFTALGKISKTACATLLKDITKLGLENHIRISSDLNPEVFIEQLKQADIYLQIEDVDKHGNGGLSLKSGALAAALSCGLPIIATKGKMSDIGILRDREHVLYVKNEPRDIAKALMELLSNSSLSLALKQQGKRYYEENLTWERIGKNYNSVLSSL